MFYVKNGKEKIEIHGGNVFTNCPRCGKEHSVDLQGLLEGGCNDLYSTQVYCHACSVERAKEHPEEPWSEQLLNEGL